MVSLSKNASPGRQTTSGAIRQKRPRHRHLLGSRPHLVLVLGARRREGPRDPLSWGILTNPSRRGTTWSASITNLLGTSAKVPPAPQLSRWPHAPHPRGPFSSLALLYSLYFRCICRFSELAILLSFPFQLLSTAQDLTSPTPMPLFHSCFSSTRGSGWLVILPLWSCIRVINV